MSRLTEVKEIYDHVLSEIIVDEASWKAFLSFHSKVFKHNFSNSVLIYAQRQDATLVTDMQMWNKRIGRWITKGSKSIAVFDESQASLKLKYLFDVKDTNGPSHTIPVVWQLSKQLEDKLLQNNETETIEVYTQQLVKDNLYINQESVFRDFDKDLEGTRFETMPLDGVKKCFNQMIIDSVEYVVQKRCDIEVPKLSNANPFNVITHFNSKQLVLRLGTAVGNISETVLRTIESEIRSVKNESNKINIQRDRGDSLSRTSDIEESTKRRETTGEIWTNGDEISKGGASNEVQPFINRRNIDGSNASSEQKGLGENGDASGTDVEDRTSSESKGNLQELSTQRDDKNTSGGDSSSRDHLSDSLEELPTGGSFLVGEEKSVISDEEIITKVILRGSGFENGKQRIIDYFSENHTAKEKAEFLKKEYGIGGSSIKFSDDVSGFENYDNKGIRIDVYEDNRKIKLSWSKVVTRVELLIQNGEYFKQRYKSEKPLESKSPYQASLFDLEPIKKDITELNYDRLEELVPDVLNNKYNYMKFKAKHFMDWIVERPDEDRMSLSHYYLQNGDLMSDPDMELIIDTKNRQVHADTFRQDSMAVNMRVTDNGGLRNEDLAEELNVFLEDWLTNVKAQGHKPYQAYYSEWIEGRVIEVYFDDDGHTIEDGEIYTEVIDKKHERINYKFSLDDEIGLGGKTKFKANIQAIKLLKVLEEETRLASSEEQSILAKYVGWGGMPSVFDNNSNGWRNEYGELKELLSSEEYESAKASTPNAHYTLAVGIKRIYQALDQFGFKTGNILDEDYLKQKLDVMMKT